MNDVRGQEMSEITLLSFSKISKIGFLQFAEKLRGVGKSYIIHKMRIQKADILWKFYWNEVGQTTPFFEKIVFFTKYFSSRYFGLLSVDKIWPIPNWQKQNKTVCSVGRISDLFHVFWLFDSLRNQRCEKIFTFFLKKRFVFQNFAKNLL